MFLRLLSPLILIVVLALGALPARAFDTRAASAYVLDVTTGTVLMEKNADVALPPASMSKLMTVNLLFEALADGRVTMSTPFAVSERAKNMGGSTMFLNTQDRPTVEDLLQGIIVQSGNDACVVVAEGLGGTEEAFARMMTERAKDLGMENSSFGNSSGWPDPRQRMSMKDLAILTNHIITDFPQYYPYFSQTEYHYKGRAPDNRFNRNPLLNLGIGADGLKTGHTQEAGYGLVGSARQGNRRVIFVVSGMNSEKERAEEAEAIVNWAFRQFSMKTPVKAGERVTEIPVWLGENDSVGLTVEKDVALLVSALGRGALNAEVKWIGPVEAPITAGQQLAEMVVKRPDLPDQIIPLVAAEDVASGGIGKRMGVAAQKMLGKVLGQDSALATFLN
ncbi:D-alanyl-D-alanine carboxypeptidase [Aliiroseovarius sp. KMU-50]|uniref:serine-type D-Ala-D-Ala carboxypeptidase n=1 Tax=Aliiroseovarius salicola TaxID=3009082 RepID=A0ABT4W573_9RHOB|nr:D-alanyl-D-alanine carboxypeptidase family protein [Aliiroseovarius sp. KMU-50]MDA5094967.1 D-alanyl-D-alanine carboxypeptidase [Aliiroseovarius sp. KMU-50]